MKNAFSRIMAVVLCLLMITAVLPSAVFAAESADTESTQRPFRLMSVKDMVAEMGTGWNLGNTFDGHTGFTPSETLWQSVYTYQELIDAVHDYGFNTVRIPITWGNMIADDYSIDEKWISRIQDVVDYCIKNDMYVIINIHHDGAEQAGWIRLAADDPSEMYEKFEGVWHTIADRFKDYDEHLLFASMNEVVGDDGSTAGVKADMAVINTLNQIFVDTVRATGSNNTQRWLVCPGRYTNIGVTCNKENGFKLPTDTVPNRLFVEIHYYDWQFGLSETMTTTEWNTNDTTALEKEINMLVDAFTSKGIPVIMGEYGSVNKDNPTERAHHHEIVNALCKNAGVVPIYWDNGAYDRSKTPDYCFTLIDRETLELVDPETTWGIMRGYYADGSIAAADISKDTPITAAMGITLSTDTVTVAAGEHIKVDAGIIPATSNDTLFWKTSDANVATVLNGGYIHAKTAGTAVITVSAHNGSAFKNIAVTVVPAKGDAVINNIPEELELELNAYTYLDAALESDYDYDYVTFASSNEDIVTVSSIGKVLAKNQGIAYITTTTATGAVAVTKVSVIPPAPIENDSIEVSLNVYYNDADTGYFMNETSTETVTITGDGQYTITFNCATDLSDNALAAGVSGLNNLTAIYLKDQAVVEGKEAKSYLNSCMIKWDEVIVDGVPLTITQTEPKSALKANGQFDTNDPINSWDGSYVEEVTVTDHVLNITAVENPQTITITFSISDIVFGSKTITALKPIVNTKFEPIGETALTFDEAGSSQTITVLADNPKSYVAFYSSDASIATVPLTGIVNEDGSVSVDITSVGKGECVITAITQDGMTVEYTVKSKSALKVDSGSSFSINLDSTQILTIAAIATCSLAVASVIFVIIVLAKNSKGTKKSKKSSK